MQTIIIVLFNVAFGVILDKTMYSARNADKIALSKYPLWVKITLIIVSVLCILSFIMQLILLMDKEYKLASSMLLIACICMHIIGSMIKNRTAKISVK